MNALFETRKAVLHMGYKCFSTFRRQSLHVSISRERGGSGSDMVAEVQGVKGRELRRYFKYFGKDGWVRDLALSLVVSFKTALV